MLRSAIEAGAAGYVVKSVSAAELLEHVHTVAEGGTALSPEVTARMFSDMRTADRLHAGKASDPDLSPRERDVIRLVSHGCTNREVAARLFVSQETVKAHLSSVYSKLGVKDRKSAAIAALQLGLL